MQSWQWHSCSCFPSLVWTPETTTDWFSLRAIYRTVEQSSFRWLGVLFLLLYLESWHFSPGDERLTPAWLSQSGKTKREREREKCQQKWDGEKRERTKGRESGMESFMWTVYVETAVTERLALWKHLQAHQSKELHLHQCLCVRERDVHMQAHVTVQVCVGTFVCEMNYIFGNTE